MNDKKYHIDSEPASASDIIKKAKGYGYEGYGGIFQTSVASGILRENGHAVGDLEEIENQHD